MTTIAFTSSIRCFSYRVSTRRCCPKIAPQALGDNSLLRDFDGILAFEETMGMKMAPLLSWTRWPFKLRFIAWFAPPFPAIVSLVEGERVSPTKQVATLMRTITGTRTTQRYPKGIGKVGRLRIRVAFPHACFRYLGWIYWTHSCIIFRKFRDRWKLLVDPILEICFRPQVPVLTKHVLRF